MRELLSNAENSARKEMTSQYERDLTMKITADLTKLLTTLT